MPSISSISSSGLDTLLNGGLSPLLLAKAWDSNPRGNTDPITGEVDIAGMVYGNRLQIVAPDADLRSNNVVGSILTPDTGAAPKYRIIKQETYSDSYGDTSFNCSPEHKQEDKECLRVGL